MTLSGVYMQKMDLVKEPGQSARCPLVSNQL